VTSVFSVVKKTPEALGEFRSGAVISSPPEVAEITEGPPGTPRDVQCGSVMVFIDCVAVSIALPAWLVGFAP